MTDVCCEFYDQSFVSPICANSSAMVRCEGGEIQKREKIIFFSSNFRLGSDWRRVVVAVALIVRIIYVAAADGATLTVYNISNVILRITF